MAQSEVPAITDINNLTKQTHSEVTAEAVKLAMNMVEYETDLLRLNAMQNVTRRPASPSAAPTASASPKQRATASGSPACQ